MAHPTRRLQDDKIPLDNRRKMEVEVLEKDETELRLEKMLFGDEAGFMDSLKAPVLGRSLTLVHGHQDSDEDMVDAADEEDIEEVPDEEVSSPRSR